MITALALAALLAGCSSGGSSHEGHASEFNGDTHFKLPAASKQKLPAWGPGASGDMLPIRPQKGKLMVLFFGFTSCPDVCPTTMASTGAAVRMLPKAQQELVEGAMVTVDPARDSGPATRRYVAKFFPPAQAWGYRTAGAAELQRVERAYGASSEVESGHEGEHGGHGKDNYDVGHSSFRYAINDQGKVVLMWQESVSSEEVAEDLKRLLAG